MIHSLLYQSPLAEKMRPHTQDAYYGQSHLKDKIAALIHAKRLPSLLLFGPPGCGKSSLAILLAKSHNLPFIRVSAPEAGLTQLRKNLKDGHCLILDELHRFSKAQQDFFLPILESGTITLIATTTENPSFCITRQLLSRLHLLKLLPLEDEDLKTLAKATLNTLKTELEEDVLDLLIQQSYGDARSLLNLIEFVCELPSDTRNLENIQKSLPEIVLKHDKKGDSHYERISALIKSIRGSDPDAALYYLAALLEAGEDPRFICRRLILSASEDVGLADPQALNLAVSCQQAVEFIGMPEGFIPLSETVVYLALAPKSNTTYAAYKRVAQEIKEHGIQPIPLHLRNATTDLQKQWGYAREYRYPHNFPSAYVEQDYLPDAIKENVYYFPKDQGLEKKLNEEHQNKIRRKTKSPH